MSLEKVNLSDSDWLVLFGAPECIAAFGFNNRMREFIKT